MSKEVAAAAIRGSHKVVNWAEEALTKSIAEHGKDARVEFPETAFFYPMAYALLGLEIKTLADVQEELEWVKRELLSEEPGDHVWVPYLSKTLDAGIATMLAQEILMGMRYLNGEEPRDGWHGFISDTILRTLGIQLVDGRMPGFAAVIGAAPDTETAVKIIRELQKRNILSFLIGNHNGVTMRDQLLEAGVIPEDPKAGWDIYVVPLGPDTESGIYCLNWAMRGALTFGGHKKGDWKSCLKYTQDRIFAFGLGLGTIDDHKYAMGAGAIDMGFPVICDTEIPEIRPTGVCTYEELVRELDHDAIVARCIDVRGVKVTVTEIDVPVPVAAAFEGETVRKEEMQLQFGSKYSSCFEYLQMRDMDEVEDGKVELIGPDCDTVEQGGAMPLGIHIEVAGRKMQEDFESILERQTHTFLNHAHGIFHMGQRDMAWIRISKEAYAAGFRLKHFGTLLHAGLKNDFPAIVDKVQVTIMTEQDKIDALLPEARKAYAARDERMGSMTDESVDIFYSCTLCQSYAPNHVCIISPERLGLCGAYNWLDGKASYEINPTGPNQPVEKGECLDPVAGEWKNINEFVYVKSNRTIERFCAYSLMNYPMTSCGCFECILAVVPGTNGVMIVNREYTGMTPIGMKFSTLAGSVGGGHQTPGFLGVGRLYMASKKFISAEGGLPRLVWMPKELKEDMRERLQPRCEELGMPDLLDKIADETVATDLAELVEFLTKKEHPALTMDPLM